MAITAMAVIAAIASVAGGSRLGALTSAAARRRRRASTANRQPLRDALRDGGAGCWNFSERAPLRAPGNRGASARPRGAHAGR